MDRFEILRSGSGLSFAEALFSLRIQLDTYLAEEASAGRQAVFARFFLSDAQNQVAALRAALETYTWPDPAISIVEQPPLEGCRIAVLVHTSARKPKYLFHSLRLTEEEALGLDSYAQGRLLFKKYLEIIRPLELNLRTHCVRTWIYVRDIDANYPGLVRARNDVFAEEGLSYDTHYIASTGIGGATETRSAVVAIDFLTRPDIEESDKTYLKALSHLSPTHDYGVAFERGVRLSDGQIYISGTASIDHRGQVLHEGNVHAQADRLVENIEQLLLEAGSSLDKVPYFLIYLRDMADFNALDGFMQRRFPHVPRIILEARVCRPTWLVEMECEVTP